MAFSASLRLGVPTLVGSVHNDSPRPCYQGSRRFEGLGRTTSASHTVDLCQFSGVECGSSQIGTRTAKGAARKLRGGRGRKSICCASVQDPATTQTGGPSEAEREAWEKRKAEAKDAGTATEVVEKVDTWQWTLNWDFITPNIAVGSCPRSAEDVDRIVDEAGVDAIINLQSDICFDALNIPFPAIAERALERGALLRRVPVRDFDKGDQALMLPEAVRTLHSLLSRGRRVYVHCTAGINRATLTVVGYLTFVQGMELEEAVKVIKTARKVAHPYIECWQEVRRRLLDGKTEQLTAVSQEIYAERCKAGKHGNMQTDWAGAQQRVCAETFRRWLEVDLNALDRERELTEREARAVLASAQADLAALREKVEKNLLSPPRTSSPSPPSPTASSPASPRRSRPTTPGPSPTPPSRRGPPPPRSSQSSPPRTPASKPPPRPSGGAPRGTTPSAPSTPSGAATTTTTAPPAAAATSIRAPSTVATVAPPSPSGQSAASLSSFKASGEEAAVATLEKQQTVEVEMRVGEEMGSVEGTVLVPRSYADMVLERSLREKIGELYEATSSPLASDPTPAKVFSNVNGNARQRGSADKSFKHPVSA